MTESFPNWTAYHEWLINSDSKFSIYKLDEKDGAISIEYCTKEEFQKQQMEQNEKSSTGSRATGL